jgi:hypothetical protein
MIVWVKLHGGSPLLVALFSITNLCYLNKPIGKQLSQIARITRIYENIIADVILYIGIHNYRCIEEHCIPPHLLLFI